MDDARRFKKGSKNTIVVLEPIGPTDERRAVIDPATALYHCLKAKVVDIYDIFTKERVERATDDSGVDFVVGKTVSAAPLKGLPQGIAYYKTEVPALYYKLSPDLLQQLNLDKYRRWYDDGALMEEWIFADGMRQSLKLPLDLHPTYAAKPSNRWLKSQVII